MFTFLVSPEELFKERTVQMRSWGIPLRIIKRVQSKITDTWADGPSGWSYEWSKEAEKAEIQKKWLLASLCYGAARFPCASTPSRQEAQKKQIENYIKASDKFPCRFDRRTLNVPYRTQETQVVVHVFSRKSFNFDRPILCLSGGVDTYKVELHKLALVMALGADLMVAAIDMPGTGESRVPLAHDAEQIYIAVLKQLQSDMRTPQKTAALGISFGGHWSAKLGLMRAVDAAVDIGGPVGYIPLDFKYLKHLPNGMSGIVANAAGLTEMPTDEQAGTLLKAFSLRQQGLFDVKEPSPLLVINGANDPYIPSEETTVFKKFPNASVWLVMNTTHCGSEKFSRFVPAIVVWLRNKLHGPKASTRILSLIADIVFPSAVP